MTPGGMAYPPVAHARSVAQIAPPGLTGPEPHVPPICKARNEGLFPAPQLQ